MLMFGGLILITFGLSVYLLLRLQLISWNYGQFSMSIALYWVDPVIWALEYQQIIGSLTRIAVYADPVIFMKLFWPF